MTRSPTAVLARGAYRNGDLRERPSTPIVAGCFACDEFNATRINWILLPPLPRCHHLDDSSSRNVFVWCAILSPRDIERRLNTAPIGRLSACRHVAAGTVADLGFKVRAACLNAASGGWWFLLFARGGFTFLSLSSPVWEEGLEEAVATPARINKHASSLAELLFCPSQSLCIRQPCRVAVILSLFLRIVHLHRCHWTPV